MTEPSSTDLLRVPWPHGPRSVTTGPVLETRSRVRSGVTTAVDVTREALDRVRTVNPTLNALTQVFDDAALRHAALVDDAIARGQGDSLPLAGVPIAIKDNICLGPDLNSDLGSVLGSGRTPGYGGFTTCASRMLEHYRSPYTATAAQRLIDAGAIIIGKANMDEFGMGSSTERSIHGPTRNPHDRARVAGGSSGGSAAAVASGMVATALGSDTGGSIRQPASFCGCVGLKPTYGKVSRHGLVAYASSLDQIGPLTCTVGDAAAVLDVISGHDPLDATSDNALREHASDGLAAPIADVVLGVPRQIVETAQGTAAGDVLAQAIEHFRSRGVTVIEVDFPGIDFGIAAYYIIATAEASSNLARFDGVRYGRRHPLAAGEGLDALYVKSRTAGFGEEVRKRIMLGTHVLSSGYYDAYYATALRARAVIRADYATAFERGCHAVLMPTTPGTAFRLGEKTEDALTMYLEDVYTVGVNLAGLPAVSIPFEPRPGSLPMGIQLVGRPFGEASLLRITSV